MLYWENHSFIYILLSKNKEGYKEGKNLQETNTFQNFTKVRIEVMSWI